LGSISTFLGTAKGDPTEANWVGEQCHRDRELVIGSVKGNIGLVLLDSRVIISTFLSHTEITAFLASLSKVLSILEHNVIPATANLISRNPAIEWDKYGLRVPVKSEKLSTFGLKPLVSIASSGIGGSNGHVVLEGPPTIHAQEGDINSTQQPILVMAGGLTPRTASSIAESTVAHALQHPKDLRLLSTVMGRRCRQMIWRSYSIIGPSADASSSPPMTAPQFCPRKPPSVVFVFSGQGPQHQMSKSRTTSVLLSS
jgi:acyl transferase domain-containing protein